MEGITVESFVIIVTFSRTIGPACASVFLDAE